MSIANEEELARQRKAIADSIRRVGEAQQRDRDLRDVQKTCFPPPYLADPLSSSVKGNTSEHGPIYYLSVFVVVAIGFAIFGWLQDRGKYAQPAGDPPAAHQDYDVHRDANRPDNKLPLDGYKSYR